MNLVLTPKKLSGILAVPSSKSAGHRELICAALADGKSLVKNITPSEDLEATCRVLQAFGATVETVSHEDGRLTVAVTGGLRQDHLGQIAANPVRPCVFSFPSAC